MNGSPAHVVCVDDDRGIRQLVAERLRRSLDDVTVTTVAGPDDAEAVVAAGDPPVDCVVSDYELPGRDGLDLLASVRERWPDLPFLLFTGRGSEEVASDAISAGVTDYVRKGGSDSYTQLADRVEAAVDRRRTEAALRAERRLFGTVLETTPNGVLLVDTDGDDIVYANRRAREILRLGGDGDPRSGPVSEPPGETYPAPTWEYVDLGGRYTTGESAYETAARTGEAVYDVRHAIAFPDGTRRLIAADAAPVSEGRETEYVVVAVADVTDSETERARAERHRVLVEHADDAMAVLEDGRYRLVNEACGDLLGVSPEAAVGSTDRDLLPSDVASALADHSERAVEAGAAVSQRVEVVCGERTRTFEVLHVPRESVVGADTSVARVCREVSEQAERERLLREERDRLESLAGAVAHDARNAIQLISGRTDLAREATAPGDEAVRRNLDAVDSGVERLFELVASLESLRGVNDPVTDASPVSIADAAADAWTTVDAPSATLTVAADTVVEADPKRLRALLENLFRNAVEHAGESVAVTVDRVDESGFAVADDGSGIPPDERDRVLEFGYTGGTGTGLGLGIVSGIAEAHGWSVTVTDSADGGARFEFRPETIDSFVS